MKVSIIIPVYNVAQYIVRCFNSVKNQIYTNIECIFIDDCSPDKSSDILKDLIAQYSGPIDFKIIKHEKNKGLSGARNTGTKKATGEYIYYLDSDDEITPKCIDLLVNLANKYPGVDIVQGNTETKPEPAYDWRRLEGKKLPEYIADAEWINTNYFIKSKFSPNAWNKLINLNFLVKNNLFFKEGIIHEDEFWMFFTAKKINSIAFSLENCYIHYVVQNSIMQSSSNKKSIISWYKILNTLFINIYTPFEHAQKKYCYLNLKHQIIRLSIDSDFEIKYLKKYEQLIRNTIKNNEINNNLFEILFLRFFLLPNWFVKNVIGRKLSGLIYKFL